MPSVRFVRILYLGTIQGFGDRDRPVKIIGVGRAQARDLTLCLSPNRRVSGMRVNHAPDLGKRAILVLERTDLQDGRQR